MGPGHAPSLLLVLVCVACVTRSFEEANFETGEQLGEALQSGKDRRGGGGGDLSASGNSEENALLRDSQETCQGEQAARQEAEELKRTVAQLKKENLRLHQKLGAAKGGNEQLLLLEESEVSGRRGLQRVVKSVTTAAKATETAKAAVKVATVKTTVAQPNTANIVCNKKCKTCVDSGGRSCLSCANPNHKVALEKVKTHNGKEVNTGTCWDGKCYASCERCRGQTPSACTACKDGMFLRPLRFYKDSKGRNIAIGQCLPQPKLQEFTPSVNPGHLRLGVTCSASSGCLDALTGISIGQEKDYGATTRIACTRSCLFTNKYTMQSLKYWSDKDKTYKKYKKGSLFTSKHNAISSPICAFNKMALCEKLPTYNKTACAVGTAEEKAKHCAREKCDVRKKISCVAIVPKYSNKQQRDDGWPKVLANPSRYQKECKKAVDACAVIGLYM